MEGECPSIDDQLGEALLDRPLPVFPCPFYKLLLLREAWGSACDEDGCNIMEEALGVPKPHCFLIVCDSCPWSVVKSTLYRPRLREKCQFGESKSFNLCMQV